MKIVQVIKTVAIILIVLFGLLLGLPAFAGALDRAEKAECLSLKNDAKNIASDIFFITENQKKMCDRHDIEIPARVRNADGTFYFQGGVYNTAPLIVD